MSTALLIAIDTETGGLDPARHPLLSLAAVAENGMEFHRHILPPRQWWGFGKRQAVDPDAARVNGYTEAAWKKKGAVEIGQAALEFAQWCAALRSCAFHAFLDLQPLAHHAGFDQGFVALLEQHLADDGGWPKKRRGFGLRRRWECSCAALAFAARAGVVATERCSLNDLCGITGTTRQEPHDALSDARACLHGYLWLVERTGKKGVGCV